MHLETTSAGNYYVKLTPDEWRVKTRNAPRSLLDRAGPRAAPPAPAAPRQQPAKRWLGWLAGVACPGVSVPAFSKRDGLTIREQFTDRCMAGFVEQWKRGGDVPITWKHAGPVLARHCLDVSLRADAILGLVFMARLQECDLAKVVLEQLAGDGCGVSVGYHSHNAKQWITERDGFGRIRIVDEAQLDHIALLPASSMTAPAYRGARAFGVIGEHVGCPEAVRDRAQLFAYKLVKEQAYELLEARKRAGCS